MKRFLAIILSIVMLAGIMPMPLAGAEDAAATLEYKFSYQAVGATARTNFDASSQTYDLTASAGVSPDKWAFMGQYRGTAQRLENNSFHFAVSSTRIAEGGNGITFKVHVDEAGYYLPELSYIGHINGGKLSAYIMPVSSAGENWSMTTSANNTTSGTYNLLNDYRTNAETAVKKIIDAASTYNASETAVNKYSEENIAPAQGDVIKLSEGDYYLVFSIVGYAEGVSPSAGTNQCYYIRPSSLKLIKQPSTSISLTCEAGEVEVDGLVPFSVSATDAYGNAISDTVTYSQSGDGEVLIENGKLTGVSAGNVTITASVTYDGETYSDTVDITVIPKDEGNAGKTFEYLFNTVVMSDSARAEAQAEEADGDSVRGIDAKGNLRTMTFVSDYSHIGAGSAKWAWSNLGTYAANGLTMTTSTMTIAATAGSSQYLPIKLKVENKGPYHIWLDYNRAATGAGADIYLIPASGVSAITRNDLQTTSENYLGHIETSDMSTSGYINLGKRELVRGDYYIVFDFNTQNGTDGTRYYFYPKAVKLASASGDFDKVSISLRGIEEGNELVALKSVHKINVDLTDAAGTPLDEIDETKLSVKLSSSDESVAVITDDGYLDAVGIGEATVTAEVTYDGAERGAEYDIIVTPVGENLMAGLNPDMENDTWIWDMARRDDVPADPWWIRAKVGTVPTDDNENNRALGIVINPETSVEEIFGAGNNPSTVAFIRSATGPRIRVKTGQFYQFSFKIKLEDWVKPDGAQNMNFAFDIYPYSSKNAGTSIAGYNRSVNIAKEAGYLETYSEDWVTVTLPIAAPFDPSGDEVYLTPVLVFRPEKTDYNKKGFGGTVWFDDFELREVGFDHVDVSYDGSVDSGSKNTLSVFAQAVAANGAPISISTDSVPGCIKFASSDTYVLENPVGITAALTATGSGVYRAAGSAALGGKNGTATLSAEMTLNGVTRAGETDITAENFDVKLLYATAETADEAVEAGGTTSVITRGYLSDGSEADLEGAQIVYTSETPDVISVDKSGTVTALRAGRGSVRVTVTLGGVGVVATVPVTVTDTSLPVEGSFVLSAPASVGFLRDEKLTITGKMESGFDADIESADVTWHVSADPTSGLTVDEAGYAFGAVLGTAAEIYAEVTINGKTVTTNTITMTVSESDLRDYLLDFRLTDKTNAKDVNIEEDGWEYDLTKSHTNTRPIVSKLFTHAQTTGVGQQFVIRTRVPYTGIYNLVLAGRCYGAYGSLSTYLYVDGVYAGEYCFYNNGLTIEMPPKSLRTIELEAGEHELTFVAKEMAENGKGCHAQLITLLFSARHELPAISRIAAESESISLGLGETKPSGTSLITADGFVYEWQKSLTGGADPLVDVSYAVTSGDAVTVDANGNITGAAVGDAVVTVTVSYNGETATKDINVSVTETSAENDPILASVDITYKSLVLSTNSDGLTLGVDAKNAAGIKLDTEAMTVLWESSDETVATVENGVVKPVSEGVADITVTVTQGDGEPKTDTVTVSVRSGKTERTYYTDEKIANAQENVSKYTWAKDIRKSAEDAAEKYMSLSMDDVWSLVPGEGIPRSLEVGLKGDPDIYVCRYCGKDVKTEFGIYPWVADALARPWKIQCQACKRLFPSNDFEKLYELGLDERGIYDAELARSRNAALAAETGGKTNYLKNTMYPEVAENVKLTGSETVDGWGVDDGFGYDTGRVYSNNVKEVHTYIAYYNHWGNWYSSAAYHSAAVFNAIKTLSEAYIYTGNEKYGRLGAVMVDRLADVYPGYNLDQWINLRYSNGNTKNGKTVNNIWEAINAKTYARAYDALFPMFDDPQVLAFLKEKSEQYETGDKSNAEALRRNIEENLIYEIYDGATILDVHGNFGHHQSAVATAAVVLDTQPKTQTMLDWVFAPSVYTAYSNSGGGINNKIINDVSRDGQGTESGMGYNRGWARYLVDVANDLAGYEGFDGTDLWENPKYIQMFKSQNPLTAVKRGTLPIGDTGSNGAYFPLPDMLDGILNAYKNTKEKHLDSAIELAQLYYMIYTTTSGELENVHFDIFTKNPESAQDEIESIIETYGEYDYGKSSMLTGYGFAALRDGALHNGAGTGAIRDTMRDFWIYFGGATSHSHKDTLNLGMEAYGISLLPDNGYPEMTGYDPNRHQWVNTTLAHNTVVVNEKSSIKIDEPAKPLHFDAKDTRVKVMDIDAPDAYGVTDEYRRTVVMVDYDDEVSYGIDFFKVRGGDDQLYSLHASSEVIDSYSDELDFYVQPGGSYAGIEAAFGNDPYTDQSSYTKKLKYPDGYTWLYDIMRADNPGLSEFWVDYKIKDIANISRNPKSAMDIHMRVTMLNDFEPDEITLAKGKPPRTATNLKYIDHMNYLLVRRKGKMLDTLFTTVLEPYNKTRYVSGLSQVDIEPLGAVGDHDAAQAVKVELTDGRIDYIIYAQNNDVTYRITDGDYSFDFRGFVGVWTVKANADGGYDSVYSYVNDGSLIGDAEYDAGALTGTVTGFTRDLAFDNFIEVAFNEPFAGEADELAGCMINVEYTGLGNAAYMIESAAVSEDGMSAVLDIGSVTLIDSYADDYNPNAGYNYDIAVGDGFEIALSHEDNKAPVFEETSDITTSAGSSVKVTVSADSPAEENVNITYSARTLPRGASFNATTGTFTWRPDSSQVGDNLVAIDATDNYGRTTTTYFTVTVYGATTGSTTSDENSTNTPSVGGADSSLGEGASSGTSGGGGGGSSGQGSTDGSDTETDNNDQTNVGEDIILPPSDGSENASGGAGSGERFIDLGNHAWAADAINTLADDDIIKGTTANTYSPANNITRADYALLLVRAFGLESDDTANFDDVLSSDYFAAELAIARNTGIVNGIGDNKYAPRNTITRQDMMVIIYRALEKLGKLGDTTNPVGRMSAPAEYPDYANVAEYARDAVDYLISNGLVNGKNGLIAPCDYTTRAEVAVLLKRILDFAGK